MKKQVAAALSIAGVLVAGSAAAMVNSQVLSSNVASASAAPATTSTMASGPSSTVATPPTTTLPTAAPTTVAGDPTTAGLAAYQVGDAGTVTLDASGAELVVVSAVANPGWVTAEVDHEGDALRVKVEFVSATTKVEFRASSLFGVITTSVESTDLTAPAGTVAGHSSGTVAGGHDGDDDEYESDDHESDDHESEDHDDDHDDEREAGDDD